MLSCRHRGQPLAAGRQPGVTATQGGEGLTDGGDHSRARGLGPACGPSPKQPAAKVVGPLPCGQARNPATFSPVRARGGSWFGTGPR